MRAYLHLRLYEEIHMDKFMIEGGAKLYGTVKAQSAKNSVLPLLAASILTDKKVVIRETPAISDVVCMAQILRELGAEVSFRGEDIVIESARASCHKLSSALTKELRSSVFMLGSLLTRFHRDFLSRRLRHRAASDRSASQRLKKIGRFHYRARGLYSLPMRQAARRGYLA